MFRKCFGKMGIVKLYAESRKPRKDGTTKVYLLLTHQRQKKLIPIDIYVKVDGFDFELMKCKKSHINGSKINYKLNEALATSQEVLINLSSKNCSIDELELRISVAIKKGPSVDIVKPFVESLIAEQKATLRHGNARSYETALKQLESWLTKDARWSDFSYEKLNQFKVFKISNGVTANSVGAYLRAYRAWINEAIKRGIFSSEDYPFHRGLIPQRQRGKRKNVDKNLIAKIWQKRILFSGLEKIAINTILLQFLLQGADFIEVSRLKKQDIQNGYIRFTRYKNRSKSNSQEVAVKITEEIQLIISESHNEFLVPVTSIANPDETYELFTTRRRNFRRTMKSALNKIGVTDLTSKGIRHTWATIAASLGVSEEIRELAMGHSSGGMQDIYTELDQREVDKANALVINSIKLNVNGHSSCITDAH